MFQEWGKGLRGCHLVMWSHDVFLQWRTLCPYPQSVFQIVLQDKLIRRNLLIMFLSTTAASLKHWEHSSLDCLPCLRIWWIIVRLLKNMLGISLLNCLLWEWNLGLRWHPSCFYYAIYMSAFLGKLVMMFISCHCPPSIPCHFQGLEQGLNERKNTWSQEQGNQERLLFRLVFN